MNSYYLEMYIKTTSYLQLNTQETFFLTNPENIVTSHYFLRTDQCLASAQRFFMVCNYDYYNGYD